MTEERTTANINETINETSKIPKRKPIIQYYNM